MRSTIFISIVAGIMATFLVTACADDNSDQGTRTAEATETEQATSIMDQPVDFSTTESAEKSMQEVCDQGGEAACKQLKNAMQYMLFYDLSVGNDKEKLHKKLDGQTPNEIISQMKR